MIREQEQEHGKPWSEIVTLSSEWAFYGSVALRQLRNDEARSLDKWLESIDDLQVGRDDVDPSSAPDQQPTD